MASLSVSVSSSLSSLSSLAPLPSSLRSSKPISSSSLSLSPSMSLSPSEPSPLISRRSLSSSLTALSLALSLSPLTPLPALADFAETYTLETQSVIDQVRSTLNLDRSDPNKGDAVGTLRTMSNDWVAKYRREKLVAGKPSFSNMYSVLNAISGHYISFGPGYPIPKKRADRILEEVSDAERALKRGR